MAVVPPKKEKPVATGIRVPKGLLERMDEIAELEDYSRNDIIVFFLQWALKAYEAEQAGREKQSKRG